jgi:hypothetical protein
MALLVKQQHAVMAGLDPAMTVNNWTNKDFVIAGPRVKPGDDPAIHGMSQCLRELV